MRISGLCFGPQHTGSISLMRRLFEAGKVANEKSVFNHDFRLCSAGFALAALGGCDSDNIKEFVIGPNPTGTPAATATVTPPVTSTATPVVSPTPTPSATRTPVPTATAPAGGIAAHGALFVADSGNMRVHAFLPPFSNGMDSGLAIGAPDLSGNGTLSATQSSVGFPIGLAFDNNGNLWVADQHNSRVLRFPTPFSTGMDADLVLGQSDFTSTGAQHNQSGLALPFGVAIDGSGDVFVADTGNSRILEFKPPLHTGMDASVVIGQPDFTSDSATTSQTGLNTPVSIAFDVSGNLWVADDDNNRVLEFKPKPSFSNGMKASLVLGQPDFTSSSSTAPSQNSLDGPEGVAADETGDVFVSDTNNNRVLGFKSPSSNGANADVVIGQSGFTHAGSGLSQNQLSIPRSQLGFDASGNLWVVDNNNSRVLEFKPSPSFTNGMNASLVIGQNNFTSVTNSGGSSGLSTPLGAAVKP